MPDFFVTGASGFVGSRLIQMLAHGGYTVRAGARHARELSRLSAWAEVEGLKDIQDAAAWQRLFAGTNYVVHLIARVHRLGETGEDSLSEYRRTNVDATAAALRGAAAAGVERFIFLSSIKVNGEQADLKAPYTADDTPRPADAYAISKWEAERLLLDESRTLGVECVILRPTLVYGPGVKANFLRLMKLVAAGVPLPFGGIDNARSLLYVDNLCDLILECATHTAAAGQIFLAADDTPISTPELLSTLGHHLGKRVRLIPVPPGGIKLLGKLIGRSEEVGRLCGSLVVDASKTKQVLGWSPPVTTNTGIKETVDWYLRGPRDGTA